MRVRAVSTKMKRVTNLKTNAAPNMTILQKGPRSNKNLTENIELISNYKNKKKISQYKNLLGGGAHM